MRARATTQLPVETAADTVVVGLLEGERIAHDLPGGELTALVTAGEAAAKHRRIAHIHAAGKRWILVGLGARDELDGETVRVAAALALGRARELRCETLCWEAPHKVGDEIVGALVEGTLLAAHRDERFRSAGGRRDDEDPPGPSQLLVSAHHDVGEAVRRAAMVTEAVNWARELQDAPANVLTPTALAEAACSIQGVTVEVDGRDGLEARGMGCFAAVAQGAAQEPALITLRHEPAGAGGPLLALVGKAVTFDTGGISIKPSNSLEEMKFDMCGAAAAIGIMQAVAALDIPHRVVALIPSTDNMPSGSAYKPGDIVTTMSGKTVEVVNTDAEGRMILCDALHYADRYDPDHLIDFATLTGACVIALGYEASGLFSNDDELARKLIDAGEKVGERLWRLPEWDDYRELISSEWADVKNSGGRAAGSITAALFLKQFVNCDSWAHVDIAGTAWTENKNSRDRKGATGVGVRATIEFLQSIG